MEQDQIKELRELVEFLKANGIAEFEMERAELKVRLKFAVAGGGYLAEAPLQTGPMFAAGSEASAGLHHTSGASTGPVAGGPGAPSPAEELVHEVRSPIVGTFYESPSPGAPAFVRVGDQVEVGQVLCIVEAMKLMNEVESDMAGEIVQRIAVSGQPVEYGQVLFSIRPR